MSIYDFDDELPEDELDQPKKPAQPKKKGKQVLNTQVNLSPRDASRLNGMHVEAITTLDDVSLPKNVIFKAGLIALGELEASKRADIIARSSPSPVADTGRPSPLGGICPPLKAGAQLRLFIARLLPAGPFSLNQTMGIVKVRPSFVQGDSMLPLPDIPHLARPGLAVLCCLARRTRPGMLLLGLALPTALWLERLAPLAALVSLRRSAAGLAYPTLPPPLARRRTDAGPAVVPRPDAASGARL